jgi:hypothetical protein
MDSEVIDPILHLRRRARRFVVAPPDETGTVLVYAITHMHVPELASLPALDVARAKVALQALQETKFRLEVCQTEEQRQLVQAELDESKARARQELERELFGSVERVTEYIERARAIVTRSVEAVGVALPDAPMGVCEQGASPEQVCKVMKVLHKGTPQEQAVYMKPLTLVMGEASRTEEISIRDYRDGEVCKLALLFSAAFSVQAKVMPLPGAARDAAMGGQAGEAVRGAPVDLPADRGSLAGSSGGHGGRAAGAGG